MEKIEFIKKLMKSSSTEDQLLVVEYIRKLDRKLIPQVLTTSGDIATNVDRGISQTYYYSNGTTNTKVDAACRYYVSGKDIILVGYKSIFYVYDIPVKVVELWGWTNGEI